MHVLVQIAAFFVWRWLADFGHADRSTCFLLGWLAALTAYTLVDRFQLGKSESQK